MAVKKRRGVSPKKRVGPLVGFVARELVKAGVKKAVKSGAKKAVKKRASSTARSAQEKKLRSETRYNPGVKMKLDRLEAQHKNGLISARERAQEINKLSRIKRK